MKSKIFLSSLVLTLTLQMVAAQYELVYQGFPYKKTQCDNPTYAAGTSIQISVGKPQVQGREFICWQFNGVNYMPGDTFVMPAANVTLVPVYGPSTGIQDVETIEKTTKKIVNGQLIIIHNGKQYNALGQIIQ